MALNAMDYLDVRFSQLDSFFATSSGQEQNIHIYFLAYHTVAMVLLLDYSFKVTPTRRSTPRRIDAPRTPPREEDTKREVEPDPSDPLTQRARMNRLEGILPKIDEEDESTEPNGLTPSDLNQLSVLSDSKAQSGDKTKLEKENVPNQINDAEVILKDTKKKSHNLIKRKTKNARLVQWE